MVRNTSMQVGAMRGTRQLLLPPLPCLGALLGSRTPGSTCDRQWPGSLSPRGIERKVVEAIVGSARLCDCPREAPTLTIAAVAIRERHGDTVRRRCSLCGS